MTSNIEDLGILHNVLMPLEMQEWLLDISIHHFYTKTIKYLYKSINSMLDVTKNMHYNFGVLGLLLLILINLKKFSKRKAKKIDRRKKADLAMVFRILKGHCDVDPCIWFKTLNTNK